MTIGYIHLRPGQYYLSEQVINKAKVEYEALVSDPKMAEQRKDFWKALYSVEMEGKVGLHGTPYASGGMTIAYEINTFNEVVYSTARCSNRDNFNKIIGRKVATGRLLANKTHSLDYDPAISLPEQIVRDVMRRSDNGEL